MTSWFVVRCVFDIAVDGSEHVYEDYLDRFFDTGTEHQGTIEA